MYRKGEFPGLGGMLTFPDRVTGDPEACTGSPEGNEPLLRLFAPALQCQNRLQPECRPWPCSTYSTNPLLLYWSILKVGEVQQTIHGCKLTERCKDEWVK